MSVLWRIAAETRAYGADDRSGLGAAGSPGRWNDLGERVIYCACSISLAVLETAAHIDDGGFPLNRFVVRIDVPDDIWAARHVLAVDELDPAWAAIPSGVASIRAGSSWYKSSRSLVLELPSVIVPEESVVLLNATHADISKVAFRTIRRFDYRGLFR